MHKLPSTTFTVSGRRYRCFSMTRPQQGLIAPNNQKHVPVACFSSADIIYIYVLSALRDKYCWNIETLARSCAWAPWGMTRTAPSEAEDSEHSCVRVNTDQMAFLNWIYCYEVVVRNISISVRLLDGCTGEVGIWSKFHLFMNIALQEFKIYGIRPEPHLDG